MPEKLNPTLPKPIPETAPPTPHLLTLSLSLSHTHILKAISLWKLKY